MSVPTPPMHQYETQLITVQLPNGGQIECPEGTLVGELLPPTLDHGLPYLGALVNNDVCSLSYPLGFDCTVEFLTFADRHGFRIYRRSLSFLLAKIVRDLFPEADFTVEHSFGTGFYCTFSLHDRVGITPEELTCIEEGVQEAVIADRPIIRRRKSFEQAYNFLKKNNQHDKLNLLRYRNPPKITTFTIDDFTDLDQGVMAPSTGVLSFFKLVRYEGGFVLQFPAWENGHMSLPEFVDQPHLFEVFKEHKKWGRIIGINRVGDLNQMVAESGTSELIRISEAFHEKKIGHIADKIARQHDAIKWILIAGPSSAGKTTFAKRLAVHLQVCGLRPTTLECDNYFVERDENPIDEDGKPDFEHFKAIDLALLHDHLRRLSEGEKVEIPRFNFHEGKKEYKGDFLQLDDDQVVIIEGIHGLNPELTANIPSEAKYKIYINCITQLNLDKNNRLSTTDMRLIRRMVRDHRTRGNNALRTLQFWPSVRRGEKRWIFPFQAEANITFNSSLDYELSIIKPYVRPLLAEVKPFHPEYAEARRLLDFLEMINSDHSQQLVPTTSLIREFIGGSAFS